MSYSTHEGGGKDGDKDAYIVLKLYNIIAEGSLGVKLPTISDR